MKIYCYVQKRTFYCMFKLTHLHNCITVICVLICLGSRQESHSCWVAGNTGIWMAFDVL